MKPCDCKDQQDAEALISQGIGFNEWSINVMPNVVEMSFSRGTLRIPMSMFKMMAEWYLEDQIKDN
jgi:hypothetical protein